MFPVLRARSCIASGYLPPFETILELPRLSSWQNTHLTDGDSDSFGCSKKVIAGCPTKLLGKQSLGLFFITYDIALTS